MVTKQLPSRSRRARSAVTAAALAAAVLAGGGTFALWQEHAPAAPGDVIAGEMALTSQTGKWTSDRTGAVSSSAIASYRMTPGETLTFTQVLNATVESTNLEARLTPVGWEDVAVHPDFTLGGTTFTNADGDPHPSERPISSSGQYTATSKVTLNKDASKESYGTGIDLSSVGYVLEQFGEAPVKSIVSRESTTALGIALEEHNDELSEYAARWADTSRSAALEPMMVEILADAGVKGYTVSAVDAATQYVQGATGHGGIIGILSEGGRYVTTGSVLTADWGNGEAKLLSDFDALPSQLEQGHKTALEPVKTAAVQDLNDSKTFNPLTAMHTGWGALVDQQAATFTLTPSSDENPSFDITVDGADGTVKVTYGDSSSLTSSQAAELLDPSTYAGVSAYLSTLPVISQADIESMPDPSAELNAMVQDRLDEIQTRMIDSWK